jgi:Rrf2 family iron-sulfur cluster assembly transcriptional regulator
LKLTTKGRYAVTAMIDLAMHCKERPVSLAEVSRRQEISLSYLEQLFSSLRKHGLVESVRGPGGGYRLGKASGMICVAEVIEAVHENVDTTACGGAHNCKGEQECLTHDLWFELSEKIRDYLSGVTLDDLTDRRLRKGEGKSCRSPTVTLQSESRLGR